MWFASSRSVQLTTIHQPRYDLGKCAMELTVGAHRRQARASQGSRAPDALDRAPYVRRAA
jgi:DNA-binding LacI/PurR family transcriptional regulator